jgi:lysophospholipase L1-like esterase
MKKSTLALSSLAVSLVATFVVLEVAARVYFDRTGREIEVWKPITGYYRKGRVSPHPFVPYVLTPESRFDMHVEYPFSGLVHWSYTINAEGFRGRSVVREKGTTTFRVVTMGGSATFGDAVDDEQTWSAQLEDMLRQRYPQLDVEVLNFGIPSATSASGLILLALRAIHFQPDLVVFYEGVNDIQCCLGSVNFRTDYSHALQDFEGMSPLLVSLPEVFYASYAVTVVNGLWNRLVGNIFGAIDAGGSERASDGLHGIDAVFVNIINMEAIARAHGAEFLLSTYHWYSPNPVERRFNEALRGFAREQGMHLVDQAALIPTGERQVHVDYVHFTEYGNTLMARNLLEYIESHGLMH